uniref:XK-related protein n=1 Tax=Strigamia maritima TaxID=126957 RepID=T1J2U9_STRMM
MTTQYDIQMSKAHQSRLTKRIFYGIKIILTLISFVCLVYGIAKNSSIFVLVWIVVEFATELYWSIQMILSIPLIKVFTPAIKFQLSIYLIHLIIWSYLLVVVWSFYWELKVQAQNDDPYSV